MPFYLARRPLYYPKGKVVEAAGMAEVGAAMGVEEVVRAVGQLTGL